MQEGIAKIGVERPDRHWIEAYEGVVLRRIAREADMRSKDRIHADLSVDLKKGAMMRNTQGNMPP